MIAVGLMVTGCLFTSVLCGCAVASVNRDRVATPAPPNCATD